MNREMRGGAIFFESGNKAGGGGLFNLNREIWCGGTI